MQRATIPRDRATWGHALLVAAVLNAAPFALFAYGETHVSSVLAGVLNATTPLTTLVFVLALVPQEQLTVRRMAGLVTGFAGVLVVIQVWRGIDGSTVSGGLACLAATTCMGLGFAYTRRFFSGRSGSATALATAQITCATVQLLVLAPWFAGRPTWPGTGAVLALVVLGALGTGVAYILNMKVIRAIGPTIAATVTYLIPLWSTLIGALLLSEPLGWNTVAGGLTVIAGVLLTQAPPNRPRRRRRGEELLQERCSA